MRIAKILEGQIAIYSVDGQKRIDELKELLRE